MNCMIFSLVVLPFLLFNGLFQFLAIIGPWFCNPNSPVQRCMGLMMSWNDGETKTYEKMQGAIALPLSLIVLGGIVQTAALIVSVLTGTLQRKITNLHILLHLTVILLLMDAFPVFLGAAIIKDGIGGQTSTKVNSVGWGLGCAIFGFLCALGAAVMALVGTIVKK